MNNILYVIGDCPVDKGENHDVREKIIVESKFLSREERMGCSDQAEGLGFRLHQFNLMYHAILYLSMHPYVLNLVPIYLNIFLV